MRSAFPGQIEERATEYQTVDKATIKLVHYQMDDAILGQRECKHEIALSLYRPCSVGGRRPVVLLFYGPSGVGKDIVVIRVLWVDRHMRPVFINDSIFDGTFRRPHIGDHLCGREEVLSMMRDSDTSSQDAAVAENVQLDHISRETVERYRRRFNERNEGHVWGRVDDTPAHEALREYGVEVG